MKDMVMTSVDFDLKDLLAKHQIDPGAVLVLRHTPKEPQLKSIFRWLAANQPTVFNAYQQTQTEVVEQRMKKAKYVAAFIGHAPGSALFVGLYERYGEELLNPDQIRKLPGFQGLKKYGMEIPERPQFLFDLKLREDFFGDWKGKLAIEWPGGEINWHRFANQASFGITTLHEESLLGEKPPLNYREWDLDWNMLNILPESWKAVLRGWCGIYFIFDSSDGKGYVGKASGSENLLGRWMNYKDNGDGGNVKLRGRDPKNFRFSILELVPGDMEIESVEEREQNWMLRLRTRTRTHGLNLPELDF